MASTPDHLSFVEIASISQSTLYLQMSATIVVLWDHITTLDLEVELIWKKKPSLVQLLYFINRYSGDALFLHGTTCPSGRHVQSWLSMIALWSMQGININRVWCMYRYSKSILVLLLVAFFSQIVASSIVVALDTSYHVIVPMLPNQSFCISDGWLPWSWIFLCFIIAFDTLIFVLALLEAVRYLHSTRRPPELKRRGRPKQTLLGMLISPWVTRGSLVRVLLRDSILFPFLGLASSILCLLSWLEVLPWGSIQVTMVLNALASPILGSRLIINLRDAYYQPFAEEVDPTDDLFTSTHLRTSTSTNGIRLRSFEMPMTFADNETFTMDSTRSLHRDSI
ncbi:hypothetical protein CC1G_12998 [Coprinopsis cinerea okayama7|uniref:DUF6533 domain-containing protein n=1 Tax=Coprinopsis cinerea (strain Okayama-7 / 130 / ATCC MYA-4618 / FGSC 9003) TaxID=240176 RepID=A8P6W3_COPC7|nr:hypothetical protein CC1G_12998 [Coprinopsis cinerea okayama7\|eukprot:XP_001839240.2 hypothetical protein CC1G_12998 [Coprinopsis cinerea okayama7\